MRWNYMSGWEERRPDQTDHDGHQCPRAAIVMGRAHSLSIQSGRTKSQSLSQPSSGSYPSRAAAHVSHKQEGVRSLVSCACVIRPFKQNKSERASEWVSGSPSISFAGNLDWTGVGLSVGGRKKTILCCGDWQFASAKELSTRAFISIEVQLR